MRIRGRTIFAAGLAAVVALPGAALGARGSLELPGWMARMMDDAPPEMERTMHSPEMQEMMRSPEMEQMMRSPGMRRMMEDPAEMDEMMNSLEMLGIPRDAPSR